MTTVVRTLLAAAGIGSPTAVGAGNTPAAPGSLLVGLLALIRREIEHTFFNQAPRFPTSTTSLTTGNRSPVRVTGLPARDGDGDTITYSVPQQGAPGGPKQGTVAVIGNQVTYTPDDGATGEDTFTLTASDAATGFHFHGLDSLFRPFASHTATQTVTVRVAAANQAPVGKDDRFAIDEDSSAIPTGNVLANDSDTNGDKLFATIVSGPLNAASFELNSDGTFTYIPRTNFNGTDSFTYQVGDGSVQGNVATATINIAAQPDPITAHDDPITVQEDGSRVITFSELLENDDDADGDIDIDRFVTDGELHGTLTDINRTDRTVKYTPAANYTGPASFSYVAVDSDGNVSTAKVNITVSPVNDAPVANDDTATANESVILQVDVLANDVDTDGTLNKGTVTVVKAPLHGTAMALPDGRIAYVSNGTGTSDTFAYTVKDNQGAESNEATVTITINRPPVAGDDSASGLEDARDPIRGTVLGNDSDPDSGTTLTATLVSGPKNAAEFTLNPDGTFTYKPKTNFNGSDTFTYTAGDGRSSSNTATVTITVQAQPDPVTAHDDYYTVAAGETLRVTYADLLLNDDDPDGDIVFAAVTFPTAPGRLAVDGRIGFDFTPNRNYSGPYTVTYIAAGGGGSSTGTVHINVTSVNQFPVANDDTATANESVILQFDVLANDVDTDGTLNKGTVTVVKAPLHGTAMALPDGKIAYVSNGTGTSDTFAYTVKDNQGAESNEATVTITINTPPVANPDSAAVVQAGTASVAVLANNTDTDGTLKPDTVRE